MGVINGLKKLFGIKEKKQSGLPPVKNKIPMPKVKKPKSSTPNKSKKARRLSAAPRRKVHERSDYLRPNHLKDEDDGVFEAVATAAIISEVFDDD